MTLVNFGAGCVKQFTIQFVSIYYIAKGGCDATICVNGFDRITFTLFGIRYAC